MPAKSGSKRERQYEHIKEDSKKRGKSTKRAKEIAARTVNKQRSQSGETKGSPGKTSKSPSSRKKTTRKSSSGGSRKKSTSRKKTTSRKKSTGRKKSIARTGRRKSSSRRS